MVTAADRPDAQQRLFARRQEKSASSARIAFASQIRSRAIASMLLPAACLRRIFNKNIDDDRLRASVELDVPPTLLVQ
jgi:hypothetical protein